MSQNIPPRQSASILRKHRTIAVILHCLMLIFYLGAGFIFFVISHAFIACSQEALNNDASIPCHLVLLLFFGVPLLFGSIPIVCLLQGGKLSVGILRIYSLFIAILFIPIGTGTCVHTLFYLKILKRAGIEGHPIDKQAEIFSDL